MRIGLNWWGRQRLRLWLHFLPKRVKCFFTGGHEWGDPNVQLTVGPLHVSPDERTYHVLGFVRWCEKCNQHETVEHTGEMERKAIEEARHDDWLEWIEPDIRKTLKRFDPERG